MHETKSREKAELQAIRHATQIATTMLLKRKFRPQIALKTCHRALKFYGKENRKKYRSEFERAQKLCKGDLSVNVDIVVVKLLRSIPIIKKNKAYVLKRLMAFDAKDKRPWKITPKLDTFKEECSDNIEDHISSLIASVEATEL